MQTTRIISNISFNTLPYFEQKIKELNERNIIDWAYWIYHKADEDELKPHIHFILKPSSRLNTSSLREYFNEVDLTNDKPLTCTMKWCPTNSMDDWLLYAIHHTAYLNSKGQYRRYHYEWKDIHTTDLDALKQDISNIDLRKYLLLEWLEDAVIKQVPFYQLVQDGLIPISQRSQYEFQYNALHKAHEHERLLKKYRNNSQPHKPRLVEVPAYDNENPFA